MGIKFFARIALALAPAFSPAAADADSRETPTVRMITADQRHNCKYLGLVSGFSLSGNHNPEKALREAMLKARQTGGNALYLINSSETVDSASVNGEAYSCPDSAF